MNEQDKWTRLYFHYFLCPSWPLLNWHAQIGGQAVSYFMSMLLVFDNYINVHNNTDEPMKLSFTKGSFNLYIQSLKNVGYFVIE